MVIPVSLRGPKILSIIGFRSKNLLWHSLPLLELGFYPSSHSASLFSNSVHSPTPSGLLLSDETEAEAGNLAEAIAWKRQEQEDEPESQDSHFFFLFSFCLILFLFK